MSLRGSAHTAVATPRLNGTGRRAARLVLLLLEEGRLSNAPSFESQGGGGDPVGIPMHSDEWEFRHLLFIESCIRWQGVPSTIRHGLA